MARVPDAVYCLTNKSTDEETAAALPIPDFEFLHQEKRITGQEKAKSRTQACFYRIHMNNFHDEGAIYYRFNRTIYSVVEVCQKNTTIHVSLTQKIDQV